jgi:hypothetical protein
MGVKKCIKKIERKIEFNRLLSIGQFNDGQDKASRKTNEVNAVLLDVLKVLNLELVKSSRAKK